MPGKASTMPPPEVILAIEFYACVTAQLHLGNIIHGACRGAEFFLSVAQVASINLVLTNVEGEIEFLYSIFMGKIYLPGNRRRKTRAPIWYGSILLLFIGLTACAPGAKQPTPTPTDGEFLVSFFETWNEATESDDIDDTLAYFAEDATLETVGYYHLISKGREDIQTALEYWIGKGYVHPVQKYELSEDHEAIYWDLDSRSDRFFCHGKVVVHDFKIVYLGYSTCPN